MLRELSVVFVAEFIRRLRSRPFLIGTLLGVGSVFLISALPAMFEHGITSQSKSLLVAGPESLTTPALALLRHDELLRVVEAIPLAAVPNPPTRAFLARHGDAATLLIVARGKRGLEMTAYARDPGGFAASRIARDLAPLDIALSAGFPADRITTYEPKTIEVRGVDSRYTTSQSAEVARGVATFLTFVLYVVVLLNSQMLTTSVAEEKTNRIAELLVAAISPAALLGGKVLATGAAGLLQLAIWSVAGVALGFSLAPGSSGGGSPETLLEVANAVSPAIAAAFLGFFIVGFLQYSLLFASVASLITRTEEIGSITLPLILPVIVALMIAQFALAAPDAPLVVVTSFVPLFSPFVMFTRMLIVDVPAWQVALSFALDIAMLALIIPFAGKLYRVGLLLYGRTPKLAQIWTVLRT